MKQRLKTFLLAAAVFVGTLIPAAPALAAGGSISLTANKSTVPAGGSLIVAIYVNGGGNNVNAVQADISYPASKLQYVGFSASGSAFEIGATNGGGDGLATIGRGTVSPVNGSALLGTMTFKALAGSGSASISVAGSSSLVSDGNPVPYSPGGVSVNFGAAAAAPAAKAAAPAPPKDATPPKISAVKVSATTPFSATITWTTDEPSDSVVDYGIDANYGLSASTSAATTAHSVVLNSGFLTPLTLIHYRVKSTDGAGNAGTNTDQTVQLPGVPVLVVVRGPNGKPLAGAEVSVDGSTGITNEKGQVTLRSSLGNKKVTTSYNGVTVQKPITIGKTAKPLPPVQLDLAKKPLNHWMLSTVGLLVLVLALLAIDAALFGSKILARLTGLKFAHHKPLAATAGADKNAATDDKTTETELPAPKAEPETPIAASAAAAAAADKPARIAENEAVAPELAASDVTDTAQDMDMNRTIGELISESSDMDEPAGLDEPPLTETELPLPETPSTETPSPRTEPTKSPMITHIGPAVKAPIKIDLEPLPAKPSAPVVPAAPKPTAPKVTSITVDSGDDVGTSPAADLAQRLKAKPVHHAKSAKPANPDIAKPVHKKVPTGTTKAAAKSTSKTAKPAAKKAPKKSE